MKICDLTQFYSPLSGGVKRYVHEKIAYIDKYLRGDQHVLIVPGPKTDLTASGRSRIYSIHSPLLSRTSRYRALLNLRAVEEILERERPDIIESSDPYQIAWKAIASGRALGIPVVGFYHSHFPEAYLRSAARFLGDTATAAVMDFAARYVRNLYNKFGVTLIPSEQLAEVLRSWNVDNIRVVKLGVNIDIFNTGVSGNEATRIALGVASDQKMLLYVGRLAKEKNTETLFEAFDLLQQRRPGDFHLVVIGDGPQHGDLEKLQKRTGGAISWLRYCTDSNELARYYRAADLFVHPGVQETFGLVALESQACGTPVVGIRGTNMDRVIFHEQESWARENTPEALADAIEETSTDKLSILAENAARAAGDSLQLAARIRRTLLHLSPGLRKLPPILMKSDDHKPFIIRSYRASDREGVRKLCCNTGFLGQPIDPVYEDRQLFADFLTTYYTDHEPESSFVLEVEGEICGYLLGSRKPLRNQLYSFWQNISLFLKALSRYFRYNQNLAPIHSLDARAWLARSAGGAAANAAFSHQPAAGRAEDVHHARADERVFELPLSVRRETRLRSDRHLREPARRKDVRALRIQRFESGRDHEIQGVLSRIGLSQHRDQEPRDGGAAFGHLPGRDHNFARWTQIPDRPGCPCSLSAYAAGSLMESHRAAPDWFPDINKWFFREPPPIPSQRPINCIMGGLQNVDSGVRFFLLFSGELFTTVGRKKKKYG